MMLPITIIQQKLRKTHIAFKDPSNHYTHRARIWRFDYLHQEFFLKKFISLLQFFAAILGEYDI